MEDQKSINPFESIFNDLRLIKTEIADIKQALANTKTSEKKFYSITEASSKLGVAEITIYRNAQAGKIPSKKIGKRIMIPGSFLDK